MTLQFVLDKTLVAEWERLLF